MKGVVFMDKSKYSKEARYVVEDSRILNYANKAAKRVPEITDELKRMIFLKKLPVVISISYDFLLVMSIYKYLLLFIYYTLF